MRAGRVEEAAALARQIGRDITRRSKRQLCKLKKSDTKELWTAVRQLTGRVHQPPADHHHHHHHHLILTHQTKQQYHNRLYTDTMCEWIKRPRSGTNNNPSLTITPDPGITAKALNQHYASVSTDRRWLRASAVERHRRRAPRLHGCAT